MGEAIAAFRKYALRARESLDIWRFDSECDNSPEDADDHTPGAWGDWYQDVHDAVWNIVEDRRPLADYVASLIALQEHYERNHPREEREPIPDPEQGAKRGFRLVISPRHWFYAERRKGRTALRSLADEAVREAIHWGPLAERVERYIRDLLLATESMVHSVAMTYSNEPYAHPDYGRLSRKPTRNLTPVSEYVALLEQWFDAFDGLSPFEGEPADAASAAASDAAEEAFPARPPGRPKSSDEALEKALVDEYLQWKQEHAAKGEKQPSKERFVASRNRDAVKDPKRLAAINAEHFRILENGLRSRRRKRQQSRTKRR